MSSLESGFAAAASIYRTFVVPLGLLLFSIELLFQVQRVDFEEEDCLVFGMFFEVLGSEPAAALVLADVEQTADLKQRVLNFLRKRFFDY